MRKKMAFIALALFAAGVGYGASLTLIQPNGGELCLGKANYPIQWTAVGISEKVKLVLFKDGVKVASIAENLEPGSSPYLWKVGQYMGGTAAAGGGYKVRVRTMSNTLDDFSDAFIWLKTSSPPCQDLPHEFPGPRLKLESPNGGESWRLGSDQVISWTGQFMTGKVQLQLYRHPCCAVGVIAEDLPATGTFTWQAGKYLGNTAPAGQYNIRVLSMTDHTVFDMSDQPFTLTSSMASAVGPAKATLLKKTFTLPAMVLNWQGNDEFPNIQHEPLSTFQGRPDCEHGTNALAHVGVEWFLLGTYPAVPQAAAARLYRSRVHFALGGFMGQGEQLHEAKLKIRQVGSVITNTGEVSCAQNAWVFESAWTDFYNLDIGQRIGLHMDQSEYSVDVTSVVKQWLGGMPNHGLLLIAPELPIGGKYWTCISCLEVELILKFN